MSNSIQMHECPKWSRCSAPLCPLDPNWENTRFTRYDSICFYMLEAVKRGAEGRFGERGLGPLLAEISNAIPAFCDRYGRIRRSLTRATLSGSRMETIRREGADNEPV